MEATITEKVFHYTPKKTYSEPINILDIQKKTDTFLKSGIGYLNLDKKNTKTIPVYYIVPSTDNICKTIEINEVEFLINFEEGEYIISHYKWSLIGVGSTLYDATIDLFSEAKNILPNYIEVPLSNLTSEAIQFREFLLKLL